MGITNLFDELRIELFKVIVLNAFLDGAIVFLLLFLLLSIFGIGLLFALILALLFFIIDIWWYTRRLSYKYIEERNPEVREMLRTAADNQGDESLMAHALFAELIQKMRKLSSGTFLNLKKLSLKLAAMFCLSIVLVTLAFFNVNIQKFEGPLASMSGSVSGYFNDLLGSTVMKESGIEEGSDDIFGEPSMANLGSDELDIKLTQNLNQIDFNSVEDPESAGRDAPDSYPVEVGAQASSAYTGGLQDVSERKTAAEYSQELKR